MIRESTPKNNNIRILSLNGGGARGMFTISTLAELERIIMSKNNLDDVRIGKYFDLIVGTSIGGILALALASGKSARDLEITFLQNAIKIFPTRPNFINSIKKLIFPLYSSEPLRATIDSMIGSKSTFEDLSTRVVVPSINLSTGKSQFFKTPHNPDFTRDGKIKLIDAALATSAAPTYFESHYCSDLNAYFADGGLVANNPSYIGLLEVFKDMSSDFPNPQYEDIYILNIGTLADEYAVSPKILGMKYFKGYFRFWGGGERLILTTMTANQQLHKNMLLRELSAKNTRDNYIVLDDTIPNEASSDITLDNATESSLRNMQARGKQLASVQYSQNIQLRDLFNSPAKPFKRNKL
ncbi:CBASS cGAMP-activated phospholipase [Morganella morganii]|uniref:CBASS cGAMP-activated phospholipase n=1 Tax=Morganella morganii TaxID=582 RepID=UPI00301DA979